MTQVRINRYADDYMYGEPIYCEMDLNNVDFLKETIIQKLKIDKSRCSPQTQKKTFWATVSIQVGEKWNELNSLRMILKPVLTIEDKAKKIIAELNSFAQAEDVYELGLPNDYDNQEKMIDIIKNIINE